MFSESLKKLWPGTFPKLPLLCTIIAVLIKYIQVFAFGWKLFHTQSIHRRIADSNLIEIHQEVSDLWDKTNVCSNRVFVWNDEEGEGEEKEEKKMTGA